MSDIPPMGRPTEFGDLSPWTLERTEFFGVSKTPVCCYPVTLDGELLGYVWAGLAADDDTAGFIPRHGMGATGFDAQGTWLGRLKRARDKGMSPAEAVRQWVGAPEDPRGGGECRRTPRNKSCPTQRQSSSWRAGTPTRTEQPADLPHSPTRPSVAAGASVCADGCSC